MNLRIEGNKIRYKISRIELEHLDNGGVLSQSTSLDNNQTFNFKIIPKILSHVDLTLQVEPTIWSLFVNVQAVKDMMDSKPSRKGLNVKQGPLNLTLQIDIRHLQPGCLTRGSVIHMCHDK